METALSEVVLPSGISLRGFPPASVIRRPGLLSLPAGTERYRVRGGGSALVPVLAGDRFTVIDVEGGQACEVAFFDERGTFDCAGFGASADGGGEGLQKVLAGRDESAARLGRSLQRRGANPAQARTLRLFGSASSAASRAGFLVLREGLLLVMAPATAMEPGMQNTATPLELLIERHNTPLPGKAPSPEPLADPLQDIRIDARTASAYFVRAGEFIQIVDVSGRQCTDFQAFAARKLDRGQDLGLDSTVTRTLLGRSYPSPGLPSKAFDREFEPLVEIVQDTVGRHDAFATACNARYYEDMGYPGHVNCTDNFNRALAPYGIAPRRGWEALNYFYNTNLDAQNQLWLDEPWSRPGDYVLMRALTDIVCVSSACPDDIDAANGWNPTDIHVRTYASTETFSKAVAFRMTPEADPELTRETAFHPRLAALTRQFVEYRGFWLASRYHNEGPIEEYWGCREKAALMDLSPLRKFEVTGPDAEALLQYCLTRDVRKLSTGQVVYAAMCYPHGGMIDDGTLFRLGQNNFRWVGGTDLSGLWLREQAQAKGFNVWVRSSTDQLHNIALQGPASRAILQEILWTAATQPTLAELGWFRFSVARLGGFDGEPVVVSRTGYTGELGYEIFCHPKDALAVFDAVWVAGQKHGLKPMGLEALDMVRIEAGLVFAHYEFSDQIDPFEAGIGFTVALKTKADDFVGREALLGRKEHPRFRLVGLDIDSNEAVSHGDCVHVGRAQIGVVTSATRSPILGKSIALARVDAAASDIGTEIEIGKLDGQQKRLPGRIVPFPHYDAQKSRVRS
jgi:aminomethyltransferase